MQGIADGDVATGVKGFDPIANNQLTQDEIDRRRKGSASQAAAQVQPGGPSARKNAGDRATRLFPSGRTVRRAILWLVKFHPELSDGQISKLVGTTKPTIQSIRDRSHWNISNIQPIDPVALGLCKQSELDAAVHKAAAKNASEGDVMTDEERRKLVSTEQSLDADPEPRIPTAISGLETFTLTDKPEKGAEDSEVPDADSFFNLPESSGDDSAEEDATKEEN